jgi:hypothetical protein
VLAEARTAAIMPTSSSASTAGTRVACIAIVAMLSAHVTTSCVAASWLTSSASYCRISERTRWNAKHTAEVRPQMGPSGTPNTVAPDPVATSTAAWSPPPEPPAHADTRLLYTYAADAADLDASVMRGR